MNIEKRRKNVACLFFMLLGLIVCWPNAFAQAGVITWLYPDAEKGMFRLESASPDAQFTVTSAEKDRKITNARDFKAAGWMFTEDGFLKSTPDKSQKAGKKICIKVTGLVPGKQNVYLRFFSQPRLPGQTWFYRLLAELNDEPYQDLNFASGYVVKGLGGYDPETIYEIKLGTVGTDEEPSNSVKLCLTRYVWSDYVKVGAIRIDTDVSIVAPQTTKKSPENNKMRKKLLQDGPRGEDGKTAYGVKVVSGALKVRPKTFNSLKNQHLDDKIVINAARHEYENRQIIIYSPNQQLKDVQLQASELRSADGKPAEDMKILFSPVGYLRSLATPYDVDQYGYWPDPILSFVDTLDINQHDIQSLWYRVYVPCKTEPGKYTGTVTIKPANAPEYQVPVEVNVWDIDLPKMPHFRMVASTFGTVPGGPDKRFETQLEYKINPGEIYYFADDTLTQFSNWAEKGVTAFNVGYLCYKDLDPKTKMLPKKTLKEFCDKIEARLRAAEAAGLQRNKAYVYFFDEGSSDQWPAMKALSKVLTKRFPDLMQLTTSPLPTWGRDGEFPNINVCPILNQYNYDRAQEARKNGKQVWWYTCNTPPTPAPNLLLRNTAMAKRQLMGFYAAANNVDGFLYWAMRYSWPKQKGLTGEIYNKDWVVDLPGSIDGDGQLYQKDAQGRPLPSVRMENIRDGMEDYDLLYIAREKVRQLEDAGISFPQLDQMKKKIDSLFKPTNELATKYFQHTQKLEETRKMLGDFIQLADKKLNAKQK